MHHHCGSHAEGSAFLDVSRPESRAQKRRYCAISGIKPFHRSSNIPRALSVKFKFWSGRGQTHFFGYQFILQIEDTDNVEVRPLQKSFFAQHSPFAATQFAARREVYKRFKLPQGTYCVVPSTFVPNQSGHFLLRIFTEKKVRGVCCVLLPKAALSRRSCF